ncbi:hypothetical protein N752_07345 [Desulforamulus aquiferis]|nr:HD domain-containing phosphohydrolase [Desulforamulus aquiferis]RYD05704.1 hypothetical protein N752_07345 [Desulforamulus aquiferis]
MQGVEIPLECRIFSIVNAFISMTSERSHRKVLSHEEAVKEIQHNAGVKFDPVLVSSVVQILK